MTINPPKAMRYMHYNDFNPSVGRLKRKGGRFQKAANTIDSILGRISRDEIDPFHGIRKTKSGEKRIKKCVKYDLNNNSRLVLIVNEGITLFLFAGDHVATDKWIEKNSGFDLVANGEGHIEPIRISSVKDKESRVRSPRGWSEQNLVILLGESVFDDLADAIGLKPNVIRKLAELNSSCEETDLEEIVDTIQPPESAVLVWDVFSHLRSKNSEAAIKRIDVWAGNLTPIDAVPEEEIPDYVDTQFLKTIPQDSTVFATAFKRFAETSDYKDWMLFMHPDQEKIADHYF